MSASLEGSLRNLVESKQLKWIFVGGKGGVGKTTTSCSLATALSKTRRSVLLVSTDPAHNLSDAFSQKFTGTPTRVNGFENLDAMEVEPPQEGESLPSVQNANTTDLAQMLGDPDAATRLVNEIGSSFPGIDEAMAFGTLMKSVRDMQYDVVVFDTAPTGHTMRLLGFPTLLEKGLGLFRSLVDRFGPMASSFASTLGMPGLDMAEMVNKIESMKNVTQEISEVFADEKKCTFVCVCIPEFLSVFETERLVQEVGKFGITVSNIVVNQLIRSGDIADAKKAEDLYKARMAMQTNYMEQIVELYGEDFHITAMPLLAGEVRGKQALQTYAELISVEKKAYTENMEGMNDVGEYEGSLRNVIDDPNVRWVFIGGKGGVGKTTTSSALGVSLEKKGKKVLLVSTDPAHNLSDAFGQKISSGSDPTKIDAYDKLYALEVDATEAAEDFMTKLSEASEGISEGPGLSSLLPIDTVRKMMSSVPGIDEAVSFSQIAKLARTMEFDVIVFDTAPTGHTLRLLGFPKVADKALSKFDELRQRLTPMISMITSGDPSMQEQVRQMEEQLDSAKKGLEEVKSILNDQEKTTFVCVAIAEFLSVYETERLVQELCAMNVNVRNILVNQLMEPKQRDVVSILRKRSSMQKKYLDQIEELYPREDFHVTYLPLLPMEVRGVEALQEYANLAINGDRVV
ncbi:ATPase GET3 [Gracilariopsis chorda]|uniref:ATPase ASNA1 homolog n=1 Tax=Gracilariopsis chorda TaxID=448386 RepID=A0A2V3IUE8_9FLOR|nr:ATPase GET3 [Gracilariopsis chorda]|eukprot:PXF45733.1 ATPase GET3 [Gracilariopsis chorda]